MTKSTKAMATTTRQERVTFRGVKVVGRAPRVSFQTESGQFVTFKRERDMPKVIRENFPTVKQ